MAPDAQSVGDDTHATALKDCRHGKFLYLRGDIYVGRSLELYGEYSEGEVDLFRQIISPGQVVVEVGANMGAHTVPLAQLVGPQGQVFAFEPQRIVHGLLAANLALNELFQARAINVAVGETKGTVKVPVLDPHARQNFGALSLPLHTEGEQVPLITLDDCDFPSLRLLKIDVEGMELEVLRGAAQTIKKHRPMLYVENDRPPNSAPLIGMIMGLDYRLYWHLPRLFNAQNFFARAENVFGGIISINMLCLPAEMEVRLQGFAQIAGPDDRWEAVAPQ